MADVEKFLKEVEQLLEEAKQINSKIKFDPFLYYLWKIKNANNKR